MTKKKPAGLGKRAKNDLASLQKSGGIVSEAYKLAITRREMISSLRKGIVAFAMFALLSTIPDFCS